MECDREPGYLLSEEYWKQGLAAGVVKRAIRFAFEELQIDMLFVAHFDFNTWWKRVIENLR